MPFSGSKSDDAARPQADKATLRIMHLPVLLADGSQLGRKILVYIRYYITPSCIIYQELGNRAYLQR